MAKRERGPTGQWRRRLAQTLQTAVAYPPYWFLRLLPLDMASALAGWLGRAFGPKLSANRRAERNLRLVFPDLDDAARRRIVTGMWDNAARVVTDYIHLGALLAQPDRIEVRGGKVLERLRRDGRPTLFFSAHLANWEMVTLAVRRAGLPLCVVYRRFNNPGVDRVVRRLQGQSGVTLVPKGGRGARRLVGLIEDGMSTVMLVDQRLNNGIAVPFFGYRAMTAPALARLARRFDAPIVPARVERLAGARFRVTFEPPLEVPHGEDPAAEERAVMARVNARLEAWIRERPEQWFWLHRRWPKEPDPMAPDSGE